MYIVHVSNYLQLLRVCGFILRHFLSFVCNFDVISDVNHVLYIYVFFTYPHSLFSGCLLIPSVIPELLNVCARLSEYDTQIFDDPDLRGLPLFSIHMLRHGFKLLYPNNSKDFEMVIWWMEHLSIIYSVGKKRVQGQGDERFFVPFLLHYHLSDRPVYEWDEEKVEEIFKEATTLYAQFSNNVPMTIHLFHKILAHILQSVLKIGAQADCFVNPDFPEVVLPLHDDDTNEDLGLVLVRYLAVQNIIEFKSK